MEHMAKLTARGHKMRHPICCMLHAKQEVAEHAGEQKQPGQGSAEQQLSFTGIQMRGSSAQLWPETVIAVMPHGGGMRTGRRSSAV